jgi:hypothetical protein
LVAPSHRQASHEHLGLQTPLGSPNEGQEPLSPTIYHVSKFDEPMEVEIGFVSMVPLVETPVPLGLDPLESAPLTMMHVVSSGPSTC